MIIRPPFMTRLKAQRRRFPSNADRTKLMHGCEAVKFLNAHPAILRAHRNAN